jgi:E3 ubiquitin-protein ligase HUWE1
LDNTPCRQVEALKKSVTSFNASAAVQEMFWQAVEHMSQEERELMLKFVTGRSRLPIQLKVDAGSTNSNDYFPESHTCYQQIILPPYPDWKTMMTRINIASANCGSVFD